MSVPAADALMAIFGYTRVTDASHLQVTSCLRSGVVTYDVGSVSVLPNMRGKWLAMDADAPALVPFDTLDDALAHAAMVCLRASHGRGA